MDNYEHLETILVSPRSEIYKVRSLEDNHVYVLKVFLGTKNIGKPHILFEAINEI